MPSRPLVVEIVRGSIVESRHEVVVVMANHRAELIDGFGSAQTITYPRSTIKMLQAISYVESGAFENDGRDQKFLAMACASHRGQKAHFECLDRWMQKTQISESCLICRGHLPVDLKGLEECIRQHVPITPKFHNCAGKHMAILSTLQHLHKPLENYGHYDHFAQKIFRKSLSESMNISHDELPAAIDGCGIYTYATPIQGIAVGMSNFLRTDLPLERKKTLEEISAANAAHPELVSGSGEFGCNVVKASNGRALVKGGAEGNFAGFFRDSGISFALKSMDGAGRAAEAACAFVVKNYSGLSPSLLEPLQSYFEPALTSSTGEVVGKTRVVRTS